MMNQTFSSTATMATDAGLETDRLNGQTRDEIEQEMQEGKDRYLRSSLKLKQMQVNNEIEKVDQAKCKVVEQREKVLQKIEDAQLILSDTYEVVESSMLMDSSDQQKIRDALAVKRDDVAQVYKKLEDDQNAKKKKLLEKLE